ncbi:hypothetical protein I316_05899 [Kwoniella heveanensis BCC8398]|uniref:Beta-lactamase-related domain-containing protein n=1 Tax=Kwoniella heveanensis BCC8398 TaxID=1296120 RepID=A0A1B9GN46_9TREE|nr:hypothetical protein I316_05899 [Kwoniella heveanensis BCC8398]
MISQLNLFGVACLLGLLLALSAIAFPTQLVLNQQADLISTDNKDDAQLSSLLSPRLQESIDQMRTRWGVQGVTIGLVASPDFIKDYDHTARIAGEDEAHKVKGEWWHETVGFGIADRRGNEVNSETLFAIASNSKLFTAISVGLLIENHTILPPLNGEASSKARVLEWTTKIKDILPEWELVDEFASEHTNLIDLASMRSGLPRHDAARRDLGPFDVVANLRHLRPSTEFRQAWQYNNLHYVTLAAIVEQLSGLALPEFAQRYLLDPLDMTSTTYDASVAESSGKRSDGFQRMGMNLTACIDDLARGVEVNGKQCLGEQGSFGWWNKGDDPSGAGPGGIITSAADMTKWVKELLNPSVIPQSIIDKVVTGYTVPTGTPKYPEYGVETYGLGQMMNTYRGYALQGHGGAVPGQHSRMVRVPGPGLGFMIAINDEDWGVLLHEVIANMILDDLLKLPPSLPSWEKKIIGKTFDSLAIPPDVPSDPRPYPSFVAGKYSDAGYGSLAIAQVKLGSDNELDSQAENPDESDAAKIAIELLHKLHNQSTVSLASPSTMLNTMTVPLNVTGPIYVAAVDHLFVTTLIFTHWDGPLFNWTALWTGDKLDADDRVIGKLAKVEMAGTAVFKEDGVGMFGDLWGKGSTVEGSKVSEGDTEKQAEVWFARV